MITITFNSFTASIQNLNPNLIEYFKYILTLSLEENEAEKMIEVGLPLTNVGGDKYSLTKEENNTFIIPTGLLKYITGKLRESNYHFSITKNVSSVTPINKELNPGLRVEQKEAVPICLKSKRGLINMATGLGKTRVGAEVFDYFAGFTQRLFLVPRVDLMYQTQKDLAEYYNIDPKEIGLVGNGKFQLEPITVAIPDTLYNRILENDLTTIDYLANVDVVIYDELHNHANPTSILVSSFLLNASYKLGLTATPDIPKYLILEALTGPLLYEVLPKEAINNGNIMNPIMEFHEAPSTFIPPKLKAVDFSNFNKDRASYSKLYDIAIVSNVGRNKLAAKITNDIIQAQNGVILVLVTKVGTSKKKDKNGVEIRSISHAEIFQELLEELYGIKLPIIHGGVKSKDRVKVLQDLQDGITPGAIASTGILSEGVSIPSLRYVNNLAAGSSSKDFLQRAGRALRIQEGKGQPKYIDYLDTSHSLFMNQSRKRREAAEDNYPGSVTIISH